MRDVLVIETKGVSEDDFHEAGGQCLPQGLNSGALLPQSAQRAQTTLHPAINFELLFFRLAYAALRIAILRLTQSVPDYDGWEACIAL